jgi:hypothetical protein
MMNRAAYGPHYRGLSPSENVKVRELRKTGAEKLKGQGPSASRALAANDFRD